MATIYIMVYFSWISLETFICCMNNLIMVVNLCIHYS